MELLSSISISSIWISSSRCF